MRRKANPGTRNAIADLKLTHILRNRCDNSRRAVSKRLRRGHLVAHRSKRVEQSFILHLGNNRLNQIRTLPRFLDQAFADKFNGGFCPRFPESGRTEARPD